jgi:hypothetical protein
MKIHLLVSSSFTYMDRQTDGGNFKGALQVCKGNAQICCESENPSVNNQEYSVTYNIPEVDEDVLVVSSFEQGVHS